MDVIDEYITNDYGYCGYYIEHGQPIYIYNLYVKPEYRHRGCSKQLLKQVIDQIRSLGFSGEIHIEAKPQENSIPLDKLISFYERMGLTVSVKFAGIGLVEVSQKSEFHMPDKIPYKITKGHLGDLKAAAFGHPGLEAILNKMETENGFEIISIDEPSSCLYDYSVLFMYPNDIKPLNIPPPET